MMKFIERWMLMLMLQKIGMDLKIFVFSDSYYKVMVLLPLRNIHLAAFILLIF